MSLKKQWRMVQLLSEKTTAGEMDWKSSPVDDAFQLSFHNYTLLLRQAESQQSYGEHDYVITLLNENGDVADAFTDVELSEEFADGIEPASSKPYPTMRRLFDQARRHALGTDRIIDTILDELGELPF
ncbi:hypothetical protein [Tardiphaga sp. 839_C3_N1_4]|uniref:hypothetical protein n=1 Tax=Tardiphaga sp. 839_C3_N1_4 TaxID=3240761 RepID=UPI003F25EA8B